MAFYSSHFTYILIFIVLAELNSQKIQSEKAIHDPRLTRLITASRCQTENIIKARDEHPKPFHSKWIVNNAPPKWNVGMHKAERPVNFLSPDNMDLEVRLILWYDFLDLIVNFCVASCLGNFHSWLDFVRVSDVPLGQVGPLHSKRLRKFLS